MSRGPSVKILHFNPTGCRIAVLFAAALLAGAAAAPLVAPAEDKHIEADDGKKPNKTHITADRLLVDSNAKHAEFIGTVRLTQGSTVITADRLKVFFASGPGTGENLSSTRESIKKIVAKGNVRIRLDDGVAETQQAEYLSETNTFILSGENSKVISGNNSISGSKITLYRGKLSNHMFY